VRYANRGTALMFPIVRLAALRQLVSDVEPGTPGAAAFVRWVLSDVLIRPSSPLSPGTREHEAIMRTLSTVPRRAK